ncbi:MAG: hypothetical protein ACTSQK_13135, partial [Candidatus Heimdallarchaeota archaeon]
NRRVKERGKDTGPIPFHMAGLALARGFQANMEDPEFAFDYEQAMSGSRLSPEGIKLVNDTHNALDSMVSKSIIFDKSLSVNEKIDRLIRMPIITSSIPTLLNMSQTDIKRMIAKYKGKVSQLVDSGLQSTHGIFFEAIYRMKDQFGYDVSPQKLVKMGWDEFKSHVNLPPRIIQQNLTKFLSLFHSAALLNHKYIPALVGYGFMATSITDNPIDGSEFLAKAYTIQPYETINEIQRRNLMQVVLHVAQKISK